MDAATVRAWAVAAARALAEARGPIDSLNVFPVPDGDTGTNLALTVAEGAEHVAHPDPDADAGQVAAAFARGALLGARGNSGVIVSQYLHGFAAGLLSAGGAAAGGAAAGGAAVGGAAAGGGAATGGAAGGAPGLVVAAALDEAQRAARAAVARPVEGTILSAATAASVAATSVARAGGTVDATAAAAVRGAREALARSPQALEVLRAAGVVDAGASGLVVLLESLAAVLRGAGALTGEIARVVAEVPRGGPARHDHAGAGSDDDGGDGEFEVMFVVAPHRPGTPEQDLAPELSARMQRLGGSVAVVGGPDGWHVHVHTDRPADAVAAGREVGAQSQVVVRQLARRTGDDVGVVVGTGAPGLVADLARSGAMVMVLTGWPVGSRDVLRVVVDTGAPRVVVVPGSPSALVAARGAAESADVPVDVLDVTDDLGVVVALSAGLGHGAGTVSVMREALAAARTATVDVPDVAAVLGAARRLLADGGELVTVVSGRALTATTTAERVQRELAAALDARHPGVEVVVLAGDQEQPAAAVAVE